MKLPNVVVILDKEWHIIVKPDLVYRNNPCFGLCDYENRTIYIDEALKGEMLSITFQHETIHASCYELGLGLSPKKEERLADGLSKITHQLFKLKLK